MVRLRSGHAPSHVRQAFGDAIDAYRIWDGQAPEPKVQVEINYMPSEITITQACGLLWNCTDIIPNEAYLEVLDFEDVGKQTYAACARAILAGVKRSLTN